MLRNGVSWIRGTVSVVDEVCLSEVFEAGNVVARVNNSGRNSGVGYAVAAMLTPRDREILKDIIHTHIASGKPVSSRAVSKHGTHKLSAASIRNVMADLEELGLLAQPHTSAGRVPTQAAYRLYVESLMQQRALPAHERRYIQENLRGVAAETDRLLSVASHLLSELSHQVGIVLTPKVGDTALKSVEFVPLSDERVLCVVVSSRGFVDHVVIETDDTLPREELVRISNYVTENFAGMTLSAIRDRLLSLMAEERVQVNRLLSRAIELARLAIDGSQERAIFVEGTAVLLAQPELADVERVKRVLDTFADKARLLTMLNRCLNAEGVRVIIGEDSDITSELDFSLVATSYGSGLGSLGIIGPARMEYSRIVSLVHYLGESLGKALAPSE